MYLSKWSMYLSISNCLSTMTELHTEQLTSHTTNILKATAWKHLARWAPLIIDSVDTLQTRARRHVLNHILQNATAPHDAACKLRPDYPAGYYLLNYTIQ